MRPVTKFYVGSARRPVGRHQGDSSECASTWGLPVRSAELLPTAISRDAWLSRAAPVPASLCG
jgi:hypothetical protein